MSHERDRPLIERNLKRLRPAGGGAGAGGLHLIPHDELLTLIRESDGFKGFVSTSRQLEFETDFHELDMRWNHMDFAHRPWIHGLYEDGLRIAMGPDVCVGIIPGPGKMLGLGLTPILITTVDLRTSDNEFRQMIQIAGLFTVLMRMSIISSGPPSGLPSDLPSGAGGPGGKNVWRIEWSIVSKWYLKPLHGLLHTRLAQLNSRLFDEDIPIKQARTDLRRRGYRFRGEDEGYYKSTVLTSRGVERPAAPEISVSLASLGAGRRSIKTGEREFVVEPVVEGGRVASVTVWDAVCPHQGGPLGCARREKNALVCPWHGLPIAGVQLSRERPTARTAAFAATLSPDALRICPLVDQEP